MVRLTVNVGTKMEYKSQFMVLLSVLGLAFCQSKIEQSDDGTSGSMKFTTPDLSDDEAHSPWVPDRLKCDSCKAVAYQIWDHFEKFNNKHKYKKYNLFESDILEITEELCENNDVFNSYGIKEVKKVHLLSGPGLDTADTPGVIAGGGKWPARLRDMCDQFMGRVGETKIYNTYKKNPKSRKRLEDFLCRGPPDTVRGECTKVDEVVYNGEQSPIFGAEQMRPGTDKLRNPDDDDDDYDDDDDDYERDEL